MNHRHQVIAGSALLALFVAITPAQAQHHEEDGHAGEGASALPLCPVMGEPINFAVSTKTDDGPVFFCCKMCVKKFKKNPEKYTEGVAEQREMLAHRAKVQVTCPVSGDPVDPKFSLVRDGQKILFCCADCVPKFRKNPEKYKVALANSYTYQTECPVKGGEIDPQTFTTLASGLNVYFCCPGCEKKLYAHPEKYLPNLEAQGVTLSAKEIKPAEAHEEHEEHGDHDDDGDHDHGDHDEHGGHDDHDHGSHGHGG